MMKKLLIITLLAVAVGGCKKDKEEEKLIKVKVEIESTAPTGTEIHFDAHDGKPVRSFTTLYYSEDFMLKLYQEIEFEVYAPNYFGSGEIKKTIIQDGKQPVSSSGNASNHSSTLWTVLP